MSTGGIFAIVLDKKVRFAQSTNSSMQPQFCGSQLFQMLRSLNNQAIDTLIGNVRVLIPVPIQMQHEHETALGLTAVHRGITERVREAWQAQFPETFWDVGADALLMILYGTLTHDPGKLSFGGDGLFCEWGWVLDLDSYTFHVYRGFATSAIRKGLDHGIFEKFGGLYDRKTQFERFDKKTGTVLAAIEVTYLPLVKLCWFSLAEMRTMSLPFFRNKIVEADDQMAAKHNAAIERRLAAEIKRKKAQGLR